MENKKSTVGKILPSGISFIFVSVLLCFSLVVYFCLNGSVAWFSTSTSTSSDGMSVRILAESDVMTTLSSYAVSGYTDSGACEVSAVQTHRLPDHDRHGISYSEFENALVVVIEVRALRDTTVGISLGTSNLTVSLAKDNYISNCITITKATLASTDTGTIAIPTSGSTQDFFSINSTTGLPEKATEPLNLGAYQLNNGENAQICFIIEYNDEFFSYLYSQQLDYNEINFSNDIEFIISTANN